MVYYDKALDAAERMRKFPKYTEKYIDDLLSSTYGYNGCGFDTKTTGKGMGLQNISVRVASFGGLMDIHSVAGEGTEINVELRIEN